jgi:hypothetical protein
VGADESGKLPLLCLAAKCGARGCVGSLLAARADVNSVAQRSKMSALHYACYAGAPECVKLLLSAGADPGAVSKWGETPSEAAAKGLDIHGECAALVEARKAELRTGYSRVPAQREEADAPAREAKAAAEEAKAATEEEVASDEDLWEDVRQRDSEGHSSHHDSQPGRHHRRHRSSREESDRSRHHHRHHKSRSDPSREESDRSRHRHRRHKSRDHDSGEESDRSRHRHRRHKEHNPPKDDGPHHRAEKRARSVESERGGKRRR